MAQTRQALFTVYAPQGIAGEALQGHLRDFESFVRLVAPHAEVIVKELYQSV